MICANPNCSTELTKEQILHKVRYCSHPCYSRSPECHVHSKKNYVKNLGAMSTAERRENAKRAHQQGVFSHIDRSSQWETIWAEGKMDNRKLDTKAMSETTKRLWKEGKFRNVDRNWDSALEKSVRCALKDNDMEYIRPWFLYDTDKGCNYSYDLYLPEYNLIIEVQGDYWHCNPLIYNADYFHKHLNKTAEQVWQYDKEKKDFAIKQGFFFAEIWERDWKKKDGEHLIRPLFSKGKPLLKAGFLG